MTVSKFMGSHAIYGDFHPYFAPRPDFVNTRSTVACGNVIKISYFTRLLDFYSPENADTRTRNSMREKHFGT